MNRLDVTSFSGYLQETTMSVNHVNTEMERYLQ